MYYTEQFSYTYFVAKVHDDNSRELIWKCKDHDHAIKFATALNTPGTIMCKEFGNNCGHCIKCECTI